MICVDSNVIIDFLRGQSKATRILKKYEKTDTLAVTNMVRFEVLVGSFRSPRQSEGAKAAIEFFKRVKVFTASADWALDSTRNSGTSTPLSFGNPRR